MADTFENCGKSFKIGINEAHKINIRIKLKGILNIFYFSSYTNMIASHNATSLKTKVVKNLSTLIQELCITDEKSS